MKQNPRHRPRIWSEKLSETLSVTFSMPVEIKNKMRDPITKMVIQEWVMNPEFEKRILELVKEFSIKDPFEF